MSNLFGRVDWDSAYYFLTAGTPPLIIQLLVINTIFLILFILRRITGIYVRKAHTSYLVQLLLISANVVVLMQNDIAPYAAKAFHNMNSIYQIRNGFYG